MSGALFGALLITVLSNAMNLMGISFYLSLVIKGAVIIAFVAFDMRPEVANDLQTFLRMDGIAKVVRRGSRPSQRHIWRHAAARRSL